MKKCELLVPAGGKKQLIAAVENGADAVYLGGNMFNARINADNFDENEIKDAIDFAHKRGVRVYVTMNTLVSDEEISDAMKYAERLYEYGADALLIQDLGVGGIIKEFMPDFPLHLSTQGSVYDLRGVEAASRLGYERVVLARELSFDEIKTVCENTETEIEVFVHGAMCVCYSGQCQMSRHFGGRSGNRGQCAQPCRLSYKTFDDKSRLLDTFKYPLSPKDICYIDHIGELADAGVTSLKIEGRMKSAEYVAIVTSIYRKYLDQYYESGSYVVSEEDRQALAQIFNRGGFTDGYYYENPQNDFMAGNIPKHRGIKIGKVVKKIQGQALIDVKLYDKLSIGDGIEIQGKSVTGNIVTYYRELKSGLTRIGDISGEVHNGDPVYRISSKAQLEDARRTFEKKNFEEGKYIRKIAVDMTFSTDEDGFAKLTASATPFDKRHEVSVTGGSFEATDNSPTPVERIEKALMKTGNTPFVPGIMNIEQNRGHIIPISAINDMRREALARLEKSLVWGRPGAQIPALMLYGMQQARAIEFYFYTWEAFDGYVIPEEIDNLEYEKIMVIPLVEYERHYQELSERSNVVPYISNISKGKENDYIESHFETIIEHCRETGIYVGNLSWIQPFRSEGVPVYGDFGLNIYNSFAENVLESIGVRRCVTSLEALDTEFGAYPLMISEHTPDGDVLLDRKKKKIRLIKRDFSSQCILVPEKPFVSEEQVFQAMKKSQEVVRIYVL